MGEAEYKCISIEEKWYPEVSQKEQIAKVAILIPEYLLVLHSPFHSPNLSDIKKSFGIEVANDDGLFIVGSRYRMLFEKIEEEA